MRQDKTRQDTTRQDKTRQDKITTTQPEDNTKKDSRQDTGQEPLHPSHFAPKLSWEEIYKQEKYTINKLTSAVKMKALF